MAAKTYYLTNNTAANTQQELSETSPGSDALTSPATGWTVGTVGPSLPYAGIQTRTKRPSSSFLTAAQPDGTPASNDCWRTPVLNGVFDAGTWTFQMAVIAVSAANGQDGRARFRLCRHSIANGFGGATEITSGIQSGSIVTDLTTGTAQVSSIGVSLGTITLNDEYLFVQVGWEITGAAASGSTNDVVIRIGNTATLVTTPNYTATPGRQGPNSGASASSQTNDPLGATDVWTNPVRALDSDNLRATATPTAVDPVSEYLLVNDFTFTIPSTATVDGIRVDIEKASVSDPSPDIIIDQSVRLRKTSTWVGSDKASSTPWPVVGVKQYASYGGSTDKWGTTWTPSEINDSRFGAAISRFGDSSASVDSVVDHIRVTVWFHIETTQTQTGKANIASAGATTTKTQTGVARITAQTSRAQTGTARITAQTSRAQTGRADILATTTRAQTGLADIGKTVIKNQLARSRITVQQPRTQTGVARITAQASSTQTGQARITVQTSKAQTGVARVRVTVSKLQTGVAKISVTGQTTRTQTGVARIKATTSQAQLGRADVRRQTTTTQTGLARIALQTSKPQTGTARIKATVPRDQLGRAAVRRTTTQTIAGLARLGFVTPRTQAGRASIRVTVLQTRVGTARITRRTSQTQTGVASLLIQGQAIRNQTGRATIIAAPPLPVVFGPFMYREIWWARRVGGF